LKFIELYFNNNPLVKTPPKGKKITAEHILSKELDMSKVSNKDLGFSDDKERINHWHRMGNLTLLYNTDNSSEGINPYSQKTDCYKNSDFIITNTLVSPKTTTVINGQDTAKFKLINKYEKQYATNNDHWCKKQITARSADIAELVYKLLTNTIETT